MLPLAAGALAFAWGLQTGLVRLGWNLPGRADVGLHGPLMICGFLGTLISLERAVAFGRAWAYSAPVASALGVIVLVAGYELSAQMAIVAASILLFTISISLWLRVPALFSALLAVAAAAWVVGSALWALGSPTIVASGWWLAFLVLTIVAERVELSRISEPPRWSAGVLAIGAALIVLGAALGEMAQRSAYASGIGLLVLACWLVRFDIARFTVRQRQQVRFSAVCLLAGYFWLMAAGLLLTFSAIDTWSFGYDAVVHAITIGFVLSMIFAHAPIIAPIILRLQPAYTALLYAPLALLHGSLALRIAGDFFDSFTARRLSGILTVLAVVAYVALLASASVQRRRNDLRAPREPRVNRR
jgi:hypothetical protein